MRGCCSRMNAVRYYNARKQVLQAVLEAMKREWFGASEEKEGEKERKEKRREGGEGMKVSTIVDLVHSVLAKKRTPGEISTAFVSFRSLEKASEVAMEW